MKNMSKDFKVKQKTVVKNNVDEWVNTRTGEILQATEILKPIGRQGFMITYITEIINLLDTLGTKKMKIVKYLLQEMEKSNNTLLATTREIAEKTETSTKTVTETLKLLENTEIIQRRVGAIMINPRLIHRGGNSKEKALLTRFYDFNNLGDDNE